MYAISACESRVESGVSQLDDDSRNAVGLTARGAFLLWLRAPPTGSVLVSYRENLLPRVLGFELGVVVSYVLLRLLDELVIRLGLYDLATRAMDSLHECLLWWSVL